jgi:hypothetical protein
MSHLTQGIKSMKISTLLMIHLGNKYNNYRLSQLKENLRTN